jgi:hypothetical protein
MMMIGTLYSENYPHYQQKLYLSWVDAVVIDV